jgi:hypothetical protein
MRNCSIAVKCASKSPADSCHCIGIITQIGSPNHRVLKAVGRKETPSRGLQCVNGVARTGDVVFSIDLDLRETMPSGKLVVL